MIPDSVQIRAGQTLLAGFPGHEPPESLRQAAAHGRVGGYVLFGRNIESPMQVRDLNAQLLQMTHGGPPPVIAVDQEGGRVARLKAPVVELPPMRVLGQRGDADLVRRCAQLLGRQLAALGFNLDFAPVADVDTNPENPVIGDRSFGTDADRVATLAAAFAEGLQSSGVAACAKHFPGHGDTDLDSHLALPRLRHDRTRLDAVELLPFRSLTGRCAAIMSAHVVFDALDRERPATLSHRVITDLLRGEMGFEGVVFSDDLEMAAIADNRGVADAACDAIAAGCDAVLICSKPDLVIEAHDALVRRALGDLQFARRLEQACGRLIEMRRRYAAAPVAPERLAEALSPDLTAALERELGA